MQIALQTALLQVRDYASLVQVCTAASDLHNQASGYRGLSAIRTRLQLEMERELHR